MRNALRSGGTAVLLSLTVISPAFADWTIGGFLGSAHTRAASLTVTQPADSTDVSLSLVRYRSDSMTAPLYYGYRVGCFPRSGWLGIEGEFIHLKVAADTTRDTHITGTLRGDPVNGFVRLSDVVERFSISHGVNLLLVNAVARRQAGVDRTGDARWTVTARLGAGASIPHPESTIAGRYVEGYEWGSLSVQAAAGLEMRLTRRLSLLGEYKLTRSIQNVTVSGGTAVTPLTTHHFVAGMTVRFRAAHPVPESERLKGAGSRTR